VARDPDFLNKTCEENETNSKTCKENEANSAPKKWGMIPWNKASEGVQSAQEPTLTP
jgi:hypothetical protein